MPLPSGLLGLLSQAGVSAVSGHGRSTSRTPIPVVLAQRVGRLAHKLGPTRTLAADEVKDFVWKSDLYLVRLVSHQAALLALLASLLLGGTGCGLTGSAAGGVRPQVHISERDFRIAGPKRLAAGDVEFVVRNRGPDEHELIAVRAHDPRLPLRSDGTTVNEEALKPVEAGALEPGQPGGVRHLRAHLSPGRYVLLCNMAGHYLGGMHLRLVVR